MNSKKYTAEAAPRLCRDLKRFFFLLCVFVCPHIFSQEIEQPVTETANVIAAPPPVIIVETKKSSYLFSLKTAPGVLFGQAEELVYYPQKKDDKVYGTDALLSRLIWAMSPLAYVMTEIKFEPRDPFNKMGFFTSVNAKFGLPGKTGIIEDYDWQNGDDLSNYTDLSTHNNVARGALLFDARFGFGIPIFKKFSIKPFISFDYMYFSWVAIDGHGKYRDSTTGEYLSVDYTFFGPGLSYEQNWFILSPGIMFDFKFHRLFAAGLSLKVTPFIWCLDNDHHIVRSIEFADKMWGGIFIEPSVRFSFFPTERLELFLTASYREANGTRGFTNMRSTGSSKGSNVIRPWTTPAGDAGAEYHVLDAGLGIKVNLF